MFLPENIDLARSESYDLSIRLTPDGFSFCIHSVSDPSISHYQETGLGSKFSYTENIKRLIFDLGFFSQPFHRTRVTVVTPRYTLVPDPYFDSKKAKQLFAYNFHHAEGTILHEQVPSGKAHLVYRMDEEVHSFLTRNLWNPSFSHLAASLLPLFQGRAAERDQRSCFVDFHDEQISVACFDQDRLLSSNMFPATHPRDTLYYIANVWEKTGYDQTKDALILSGDLHRNEELIKELNELFEQVEELSLTPKTELSDEQQRTLPTDFLAMLCE